MDHTLPYVPCPVPNCEAASLPAAENGNRLCAVHWLSSRHAAVTECSKLRLARLDLSLTSFRVVPLDRLRFGPDNSFDRWSRRRQIIDVQADAGSSSPDQRVVANQFRVSLEAVANDFYIGETETWRQALRAESSPLRGLRQVGCPAPPVCRVARRAAIHRLRRRHVAGRRSGASDESRGEGSGCQVSAHKPPGTRPAAAVPGRLGSVLERWLLPLEQADYGYKELEWLSDPRSSVAPPGGVPLVGVVRRKEPAL